MAETGLNQNWNRDYDPLTGKYIESDPVGLKAGVNTYGYVLNDPIMFLDPFGLYTTVRCGPVISGGYHCEVVSRCSKTGETIAFGIGGGGNGNFQRIFAGKIPPKYQNSAKPFPEPGQFEYLATCDEGCGCKQLDCFSECRLATVRRHISLWHRTPIPTPRLSWVNAVAH
jgi:uncharacterized protein RhaS with RHS repeats